MFKPTNIAEPEQIFSACKEVQAFLESFYEADNADACVSRLQGCENYMALTSKMLADAKHRLRELEESSIIKAIENSYAKKMSITMLNKYVDSLTRDYAYLVDWIERLNRACTHSGEFQRTIISKLKEEMRLAGYGNGH